MLCDCGVTCVWHVEFLPPPSPHSFQYYSERQHGLFPISMCYKHANAHCSGSCSFASLAWPKTFEKYSRGLDLFVCELFALLTPDRSGRVGIFKRDADGMCGACVVFSFYIILYFVFYLATAAHQSLIKSMKLNLEAIRDGDFCGSIH